jgi:hypothetical protein
VIWVTRATVKHEAIWVVKGEYALKNPTDIAFGATPKTAVIFNKTQVELLLKDYRFIYGPFGAVSGSL